MLCFILAFHFKSTSLPQMPTLVGLRAPVFIESACPLLGPEDNYER